jgi:hypothetical protein
MSQPELQLVSQMLAEEVADRAEDQVKHEEALAKIAALEKECEDCEAREQVLALKLAKCEAEEAAAKRALEECQKALTEERGRCTYLIQKMTEEDDSEDVVPGYRITITGRDANGDMRSADIVPKEKK